MSDVLQKVLTPRTAAAVVDAGYDVLEGPVVRAADAAPLSTAEALREAVGAEPAAGPVHVLRFEVDPLMRLQAPGAGPFATGFLPTTRAVVPVWLLERTRVPRGTELWRVGEDGAQQPLSVYDGPALGWRGARGYLPPRSLTGPRAVWRGLELPADVSSPSRVELVAEGEQPPADGFVAARPFVWHAFVEPSEAEVFTLLLTATWRGAPWRVVQSGGGQARLLLLEGEPQVPTEQVEPGVQEVVAPSAELEDVSAVRSAPALDG